MTPRNLKLLLDRLTYKPGSKIDVQYDIQLADSWQAHFSVAAAPDAKTDGATANITSQHRIFEDWLEQADEETVIEWVRGCWHALEIHEADEWLKLDGKAIFDPHGDAA